MLNITQKYETQGNILKKFSDINPTSAPTSRLGENCIEATTISYESLGEIPRRYWCKAPGARAAALQDRTHSDDMS